jgi:hypothetical protein
MTGVRDADELDGAPGDTAHGDSPGRDTGLVLAGALVAAVAGIALAVAARGSAVDLLVVIAALQALLALAWMLGMARPGRIGGVVIAGLAAATADVTVSVWPHARLGPLLAALALAVPVMFVHQLWRGAARNRVIESLGAIGVLVLAEIGLAALLQLWHEFSGLQATGDVVSAVVAAASGALVLGALVDLGAAVPRFDADVRRGLLAVVTGAVLGGLLAYLMLRHSAEFTGGRSAFLGASVAALAALFAVAVSFAEHDVDDGIGGSVPVLRPVTGALLPVCLVAPLALLICLAIRA